MKSEMLIALIGAYLFSNGKQSSLSSNSKIGFKSPKEAVMIARAIYDAACDDNEGEEGE